MVELSEWQDYLPVFAVAAILGGIGGVAFELLQTHHGHTGYIERSHRTKRLWDAGVWGSVLIGAVAAVAALWVFPPEATTKVVQGGTATTTTQYDLIKLVGLSLIIGSAGSSFLSALQARALAATKSQEAATTKRVANKQLKTIKTAVSSGATKATLGEIVTGAEAAITAVAADSGRGNPE